MSVEEQSAITPGELAPGAALAAARASAQLSIAEVARHLRLSVVQVEALESGDYERLPGPVFVRGFIRNYARLVKLDPDALLRAVEPDLSGLPHAPEAPPSKNIPFPPERASRWPVLALLGVVVLAVLVVYEFYWTEPPLVRQTPSVAVPAQPKPRPPMVESTADTAFPAAATESLPVEGTAPKLSEPSSVPTPASASAAPVPRAPAEEEKPTVAGGTLSLVFGEESWVEVLDRDGKIVLSQLNPQGTEKRVNATPPLSIVIGNAHAVRLTYKGRPVDLAPHTKVDVARLTLE